MQTKKRIFMHVFTEIERDSEVKSPAVRLVRMAMKTKP